MDCANKELSISFVDDNTIKQLNNHYLQRDHSTNVLSFSLQEGEYGNVNPHILGDIVISTETAQRDAAKGDLLSLIHISEPTRLRRISYAVFCLKKKKNK